MSDSDLIPKEQGVRTVKQQGIQPFLEFIDSKEREFFKAKDFVTLYDLIFKMCIQRDPYNWSEVMYELYTHSILDYLLQTVKPALNTARTQYDVAFLTEWKNRWNNQKLIVQGLAKLFMYLDRFYTPNTDGILNLKDQGFKTYKEQIFDSFAPVARQAILNAVEKERSNESQDRALLKEAVSVFVEVGSSTNLKLAVYTSELEKQLVEHAGAYYQRQSRVWLDEDSAPVYLEKVEKVMASESARVAAYLNRQTQEPLLKECYVQLLKTHQQELLRKRTGLFHLLAQNAVEDLSRLYRLYKGYEDDLKPIAEMFGEFIEREGAAMVDSAKTAAQPAQTSAGEEKEQKEGASSSSTAPAPAPVDANHALVRNLIGLHAQYNDLVTNAFDKVQIMQKALKQAFEAFINKDNRVSKLLAKFVNEILRKGSKVNVRDVESTLDNVVFLYGYISEKDVFERDYQLLLSSRLLQGLCESEHSEKSMIAKLKREAGYQWTNKLEGMFKDVQLSKDLGQSFKKISDTEQAFGIQLDVNVCTTGFWPSSKIVPSNMPKELQPACEKYKRFYLNQHSGHKLEWRFDQGQAEVTVDFNATTRKALVVTTYQMMIMLVFNSFKRVNLKQLLDVTGIPRKDIANHLLSLAHPKVGVLLKRPNNKLLDLDHLFMVNPKYKNALKKVTIPFFRAVDSEESSEEENKTIELQRRHMIDASIVRIMKTRKTLRHNLLIPEVVSQLSARFKPKPNDIKKRIEALIEQEYLERDGNERGTYNYKA